MTFMLLGLIPLALLKDFLCNYSKKPSTAKGKNTIVVSCICIFFLLIFLVDAYVFDKYIEHDITSKGYQEILWHAIQ